MSAADAQPPPAAETRQQSSPSHQQPTAATAAQTAVDFAQQSEKLSHEHPQHTNHGDSLAVEARFITPQDPVIVTADGNRLPGVPLQEAHKLNVLRDEVEHPQDHPQHPMDDDGDDAAIPTTDVLSAATKNKTNGRRVQKSGDASLQRAMPPSHTNPLFPPLPLYGPASLLRDLQCTTFRVSSFFLGTAFLGVIVLGSLFTTIPVTARRIWARLTFRDPDADRPFINEERRRAAARKEQNRGWRRRNSHSRSRPADREDPPPREPTTAPDDFIPTEGGPDPVVCDVRYYARRVGLEMEEHQVQTEDGFIIDLWHIYDPRDYEPLEDNERAHQVPDVFTGQTRPRRFRDPSAKRKFPVLLMHGLLQSSGAYCVNDDDSLAFYLCKAGYDVWLGNNRCGFRPRHVLLDYADPRMWCWNIRQMGVFDLSALTSRVLYETGFARLGLVAHSQGTTQTLVALAKEQRPELGDRLTVFCALAPAAYAGPLIGKAYFKFMRVISPALFRVVFGIHAFIPLMMTMHKIVPPHIYGWLGYKVFSFLFNWSDTRWDRALKDRMFQFAPVYVSAESMRWWLGRECFAKHKCILSTKDEWRAEDHEDTAGEAPRGGAGRRKPKGSSAWYNEQVPPFALWVAGNDDLVDGDKLLRRFAAGREPHVRVVHSKVIPGYEHLDVIWAMDARRQVFDEVRDVLWRTAGDDARPRCRVPAGCEGLEAWKPELDGPLASDLDQSSSDAPE